MPNSTKRSATLVATMPMVIHVDSGRARKLRMTICQSVKVFALIALLLQSLHQSIQSAQSVHALLGRG
jgi:hypothetical protein